jgi:hypothetical protein
VRRVGGDDGAGILPRGVALQLGAWGMVQNDLVHAWGLDYKLGYCAQGDRALKVGVVDSEYVLHRGLPMLGGTQGKAAAFGVAVRRRSHAEMQILDTRWNEAAAWTDP